MNYLLAALALGTFGTVWTITAIAFGRVLARSDAQVPTDVLGRQS